MKVRLQSYPPLGQVTSIGFQDIHFKVVLDIPQSWKTESWDICIWYSVDDQEWRGSPLSELATRHQPLTLQRPSPAVTQRFYGTKISFQKDIKFTFKFRHTSHHDWMWARDEYGFDDGHVLYQSLGVQSSNLMDLIPDLSAEWTVSSHLSQAPQTSIWSLRASAKGAKHDVPSSKDLHIGTPWGGFLRWFAIVRHGNPWLGPRHGQQQFTLDRDAIMTAFLGPSGHHIVLLGLCSNDVTSTFRSDKKNWINANITNDGTATQDATVLVSAGPSFEKAVAAVLYQARNIVSQAEAVACNPASKEVEQLFSDIDPQWMQQWYDGLGYCTWNSLGQNLTENAIHDALKSFKGSEISISTLIIDDNWQTIDARKNTGSQPGWRDFEANPEGFPNGLKSTVQEIRRKYPTIQNIAVWHAILGYWGGLSPDGHIAKRYKTVELMQKDGHKITVVDKDDIPKFYSDFYKFLSDAGIDGVKTDDQVSMDHWTSAAARKDLTNEYFDAWKIAALRHLNFKAISCMSQFPRALFYSQMPQNRPPMVVRNSDDFFPGIPESHTWHIWANAHNSIFMQYLNVIPDWDMFQTSHEYGGFHAAARCVSGGPIYVTDSPGKHNIQIIGQMTGKDTFDRTVTFRPNSLGKSIYPYAAYGGRNLLKIGAYNGVSQSGTPIMGVFNVSSEPLSEIIPLSDFSGIWPTGSYVVRAHSSGIISSPLAAESVDSQFSITVGVKDYEILTAFPVHYFAGQRHGQVAVANLGLLGKMTGCAAISSNNAEKRDNGRILVDTNLKSLGVLGLYISILPKLNIRDDFMITISEQPILPSTVSVSKIDNHILEVDVAQAWKLGGFQHGWSNEVQVKVYFNL